MSEKFICFSDDSNDEGEVNNGEESIYRRKFSEIKELDEKLVNQLEHLGYTRMTKVQDIAIPKILSCGDVLLRAPTGTGKTICFLVPAIQQSLLSRNFNKPIKRSDGTIILILTPTRELCVQTMDTASKIMKKMSWCVVGCISGGEKKKSEKARLRKGITVLCGTPGRILDHIDSTSSFNVSNMCCLIVDEADRLLEEGFLSSYKKIYQFVMNSREKLTTERFLLDEHLEDKTSMHLNVDMKKKNDIKVILVSATLSKPVEDLAKYSLRNNPRWLIMDQYKEIDYKDREFDTAIDSPLNECNNKKKGLFSVPINLRQECVIINDKLKIPALISLLLSRTKMGKRTVVFVSSTQVVEFCFSLLQSIRWPSMKLIRGGLEVKNSIRYLENYKKGIDNKNLGTNYRTAISKNAKRGIRFNNEEPYSDFEEEISISDPEFTDESKRGSSNNFQRNKSNKWVTRNTQLINVFESLFDKYIFKNTIFDDDNQENDYLGEKETEVDNNNDLTTKSSLSVNQPPIFMLHGHMNRDDRIGQLNSFEKNVNGGVLITSDVASRGLNFPKIDTVIQLDPPQTIEEYIHRVGRTARMGDRGTGIIFLRPSEESYVDVLSTYNIIKKNEMVILSDSTIWEGLIMNNHNTGKIDDVPGFYYSVVNKTITLDPNDTDNTLLNKARRAYIAYIRSYLSYDKEFSKIFSVKKLHLGHVASSFGINEQPNKIIGHIKYLDGVISYKEKMSIENSDRTTKRKSIDNDIETANKQRDNNTKENKGSTTRKGLSSSVNTNKQSENKRKKSRVSKEFEFKTDPSKAGLINKALMLMKDRSEIHYE